MSKKKPAAVKKKAGVLNEKKERYCALRLLGKTPIEAYSEAYSPKSTRRETLRVAAWLIENSPEVVARIKTVDVKIIEKVAEKVATTIALTRTAVIDELWDNAMRAKAAVPVLDREGKPIGEYQTNLSASNQALIALGKEIGMFKEGGNERDPLEALSYEQAQRLIDLITGKANEPGPGGPVGDAAAPSNPGRKGVTH